MKTSQWVLGGIFTIAFVQGVASPDWNATLRAQGYYDYYVDLAVSIFSAPDQAVAGTSLPLLVTVENHGRDAAHQVRVQSLGNANLAPLQTAGCQQDPQGFPICQLPDAIAPGGSADFLYIGAIPGDAQGVAALAVSVTSEGIETQPGNELALLKLPVVSQADVAVELLRSSRHLTPGVVFHYSVVYSNRGPSDLAAVNIFTQTQGFSIDQASWRCTASGLALCPSENERGLPELREIVLPSNSSLRFDVRLTSYDVRLTDSTINTQVVTFGATLDPDLENNQWIIPVTEAVLGDGFE